MYYVMVLSFLPNVFNPPDDSCELGANELGGVEQFKFYSLVCKGYPCVTCHSAMTKLQAMIKNFCCVAVSFSFQQLASKSFSFVVFCLTSARKLIKF